MKQIFQSKYTLIKLVFIIIIPLLNSSITYDSTSTYSLIQVVISFYFIILLSYFRMLTLPIQLLYLILP